MSRFDGKVAIVTGAGGGIGGVGAEFAGLRGLVGIFEIAAGRGRRRGRAERTFAGW